MVKELEKLASEHGDRLKVIPAERLGQLRDVIGEFKGREELNGFQKWIVDELYCFETPEKLFKINSILLIAIHHPFYARVDFLKDGLKRTFLSLVRADFVGAEKYLRDEVEKNGYSMIPAKNLPLKRLGAHSGLSEYGRSNITYIDGLGSSFSYAAYFSDIVCEEDTWGGVRNSEACSSCGLCMESCPTGAIHSGRFLIDNQKCLSCVNEVSGDFPAWVPATVHHTLYDCLICQRICPLNHEQADNVIQGISFSEEESLMLLAGSPACSFSSEMKEKISYLGIDEWYDGIPRNLKALFELDDSRG